MAGGSSMPGLRAGGGGPRCWRDGPVPGLAMTGPADRGWVDEARRLVASDPQAADRLVSAVFPSVADLKRERDELWVAMNRACDEGSDDYYDLFAEWYAAADEYADAAGLDRPIPEGRQ